MQIHLYDYLRVMKGELADIFDFSNLPQYHQLHNTDNQQRIGILKDEVGGREISKVYASTAKCYIIIFADNETIKKCKGIPHAAVKSYTPSMYRDSALVTNVQHYSNFSRIGMGNSGTMSLINVKKRTLQGCDTKRVIIDNGKDSLAFGHYQTLYRNVHFIVD